MSSRSAARMHSCDEPALGSDASYRETRLSSPLWTQKGGALLRRL